jgi:hypothetical protein
VRGSAMIDGVMMDTLVVEARHLGIAGKGVG